MLNPKTFCLAALVDEAYLWYVPIFLQRCQAELPYSVRVFIWLPPESNLAGLAIPQDKEEIKVVRLDYKYGQPNLTPCLRFIELEKELAEFEHVLFTDIDILHRQERPGILEQRLSRMDRQATLCYDSAVNSFSGPNSKMSAMLFINKGWWDSTRISRRLWSVKLKEMADIPWGYDENVLFRIIKESGLPVVPGINTACIHGIHLGKFRRTRGQLLSAEDTHQVVRMYNDPEFVRISAECSKQNREIDKILNTVKSGLV